MLWIEKYRPKTFSEMVGQERVRERLNFFATTRSVPHLLLTGPAGTGKSVSVECLARALYGEYMEENLTVIHTSDLFTLGRRYLEEEERYAQLYRRDESVLSNFKRITRWYASLRPLNTEFKLISFEGASYLPREAQQALRRIMERSSQTCRFLFCTSHPSAIIPAIASRCLPFYFAPLPDALVEGHLRTVLARECGDEHALEDDHLDLLTRAAGGDLRKAVTLLQVAMGSGGSADLLALSRTESGQVASAAFTAVAAGDIPSAIRRIETLMIEYGLPAEDVLRELRTVIKREFNDPRLACAIGDTSYILGHCNNEYIQMNALLTRMAREVFLERGPG